MVGRLKMNFHTPLGYFNIDHINVTSMGPWGYVKVAHWNDRMRKGIV